MTQIKISSLIAQLSEIQDKHGDLPVVLVDADTGFPFKLEAKRIQVDSTSYCRKILEFAAAYEDDLEDER